MSQKENLYKNIIFLEDYGMAMAKYLVTGVDVWLNNPRRPLEASGTSGMKAGMNGAINLSILDGWWDEAYTPEIGWAIGARESYKNEQEQDDEESKILYSLLEDEIVPTYFDRDASGIPRKWVHLMKKSIKIVGEGFNSDRMVKDYSKFYIEAAEKYFNILTKDNFKAAKELAIWRSKMVAAWPQTNIKEVSLVSHNSPFSGEDAEFLCKVNSAKLEPNDIRCELFYGFVAGEIRVSETESAPMEFFKKEGDTLLFKTKIKCKNAGTLGFTARIFPKNSLINGELVSNMIKWEP
jgi:starch phosphorylase